VDTLVCVKAIPSEPPRVGDDAAPPAFERARATRLILNESDAYAVDEAVSLRKRLGGGRVTAVTVGSLASQDALYAAMAKGANDALRVDAEPADPLLAKLLEAVVRDGRYDLVLTGIESWENLASAVGPALAARLDLPFASAVRAIDLDEGSGAAIVTRETGGGFLQTLEVPLPAVLCVQSGICPLSYPPTVRVLQARRTRPKSVSPAALGVEMSPPATTLTSIDPPAREREVEILDGAPAEVATALLDRIDAALSR
jgi:electron transfer flavoprotein beta subunit